nr:natural cytotoxicity triggering receptor 3 ligand 1-like [Aotus nancymaae]
MADDSLHVQFSAEDLEDLPDSPIVGNLIHRQSLPRGKRDSCHLFGTLDCLRLPERPSAGPTASSASRPLVPVSGMPDSAATSFIPDKAHRKGGTLSCHPCHWHSLLPLPTSPFAMGASQFTPPETTPVGCLLHNLNLSLHSEVRPKRLIFYCNTAWPQYKLNNGSQWPENGTFDFNILRNLHNFCHHNGKWSEIPYVQVFFTLCSHPSLSQSCSTFQIILACSKPDCPPVTLPTVLANDSSPATLPIAPANYSFSFDPTDFPPPGPSSPHNAPTLALPLTHTNHPASD